MSENDGVRSRVKRAQADPPGPDPAQGQVLDGHRDEVGGSPDPGDVLVDYPHVPTLGRNPVGLDGVFVIGLRPDLTCRLVSVWRRLAQRLAMTA